MKISVHDLAHSKGMPAAATEAMLLMQDRIEAQAAEIERLREALRRIAESDMPEYKPDGSRWWFDGGEGFYEWVIPFARAALGETE